MADSEGLTCRLAGRKMYESDSINVFADSHAFFAAGNGVHVFDGQVWTYEEFPGKSRPDIDLARIFHALIDGWP